MGPRVTPSSLVKDGQILRFLWARLRKHSAWIIPSVIFGIGTVVAQIQTVTLPKMYIDEALGKKDWNLVLTAGAALVILFLFFGVADFFHRLFLRVAVERAVRDIRNEIFDRLLVFSQEQSNRYTSGRAVQSIVSDVQVISNTLHVIADLIREPLMIVGMVGTLIYINWRLTLVCLVSIPLVAWASKGLGRSARRNQTRIQESLESLSNHTLESLGGLKTAHAFGQTPALHKEFGHWNVECYRFLVRFARTEELISPITKLVTSGVGALLIVYGGWLVVGGSLTTGALVAFVTAAAQIQQPLRQLTQVNVRLQQVIAAGRRIYDILYDPLDNVARAQEQLLTKPHTSPIAPKDPMPLHFHNIFYRYPERGADSEPGDERLWALEGIDLELKPGRRMALVGQSGSGKSTLCSLGLRFLDPTQGEVQLGGKASTQWSLESYRSHFSWVSQDIFLFNRSIRDNLLFARPGATDADLWSTLERAHLKAFIEKLPRKLDTIVGERASQLSGGERQRIAIARAFLKNAPIVVLDEATSNLDAHSEKAVTQALFDLMENRSVLVIAHRLSLVKEVDEVAVMNGGRLVEFGPPETLLEKEGGHFKSLWETQRA